MGLDWSVYLPSIIEVEYDLLMAPGGERDIIMQGFAAP